MSAITSLATGCLWLDGGRVRALGAPAETVAAYLREGHASAEPGFADLTDPALRVGVPKQTHKEILFETIRLVDAVGETTGVFFEHDPMRLELGLRARSSASRLEVLLKFSTLEGTLVFTLTSGVLDVELEPGRFELPVEVPRLPLRPGSYSLDLYVLTTVPQDDLRGVVEFEVAGRRGAVEDPRHVRDNLGVVNVEQEWGSVNQADRARV
jgi:hypothetical protein